MLQHIDNLHTVHICRRIHRLCFTRLFFSLNIPSGDLFTDRVKQLITYYSRNNKRDGRKQGRLQIYDP